MQVIIDFIVSLNIPYVTEGVASFIVLLVLAGIIVQGSPG